MKRLGHLLIAVLVMAAANNAPACATCYGKSDAPMAQGMNWGIMVLLGVIGLVLTGITGFFVYIAKKTGKPDNG
ncbi:MAG: hypothetical protein U1F65_11125 [Verrucomicrobiota bacterium]